MPNLDIELLLLIWVVATLVYATIEKELALRRRRRAYEARRDGRRETLLWQERRDWS